MIIVAPNHAVPMASMEISEALVVQVGQTQYAVLRRARQSSAHMVMADGRNEQKACRRLAARALLRPLRVRGIPSYQLTQWGNSCWLVVR